MLRAVTANSVFEDGQKYWRWGITFEIRPDWDFVDQSRGLMAYQYERNATGNKVKSTKPKPIVRNNKAITQPVLLDSGGLEAATPADAATLRFKVRKSKGVPHSALRNHRGNRLQPHRVRRRKNWPDAA